MGVKYNVQDVIKPIKNLGIGRFVVRSILIQILFRENYKFKSLN